MLLWSRVTFSLTLPSLGLTTPGFLGTSTLCGSQVLYQSVLPCTGMVLCYTQAHVPSNNNRLAWGPWSCCCSLHASPVCLDWDHHYLLGVSEPGAAFGPTGIKAAMGSSGLCPVSCCPFMSCGKGKGFFLPVLPEVHGEESGLGCCCGFADTLCPVSRTHQPPGAGFVIGSVTRGAQGTQVMLPELGTARGVWSPQPSPF